MGEGGYKDSLEGQRKKSRMCYTVNSCINLVAQMGKNLPAVQETWVQSLGWEDALEKGMATRSSVLAWRIPREQRRRKQLDTAEPILCKFLYTKMDS